MLKEIKRIFLTSFIILELLIPNIVFAKGVFNIVPSSLSVALHSPGTANLTYTVTNNTAHTINQISVNPSYKTTGNPAGISLQNDHCTPTALTPSSSCTFQVLLTNQNQPSSFILRPRVCGYKGLVCSVPLSSNEVKVSASYLTSIAITPTNASILAGTVQQFTAIGMYNNNSTENITSSVTWNSSNQSIATISSLGLATGVGPGSTPITATLGSISSNSATLNVAVYAYVTNFSNSTVSVCPVNSNGTLGTCVAASDPTFSGPSSISINLIKSLAYVSNYYTSIISVCPINTNGTLGLCNALIDATFNGPSTVKLNTGNTFAYIVNYNHSNVSICPINSDGTFGVCTASNPGSTFINPDVITLNQTNTFAYVSNTTNHSVSVCSVNSDGSLGSCTAGFDPTFNGASALALNSAGTLIYVGNNNGTVSVCPINSNGMLATCTAMSSATFIGNNFGKIALNILSTIAYIANQTNNHISLCPINANGTFGTCLTSNPGGTFDGPQGIGLS